ncbi:MAG: hypothetical protein AB7F74_20935 [Parvibaculaceae bacterium]
MKSSQRAKKPAPDAEQEDTEAGRPIWFLGRELKDKPAEEKAEAPPPKAAKGKKAAEAAAPSKQPDQSPPKERGPSQLEAYMRYAKMREPRENEPLAPVAAGKQFSPAGYDVANENDADWHDEALRRRPPRRRPRPASGLKLRDAIFAGIASIAVGALGGAVVYDRANDGELSQAAFDSIGQFLTGLNIQSDAVAAVNVGATVPESRNAPGSFKKPVTTARLEVNDAWGDVNTPIPLSISAEPALPDQVIALRLTGLPADAYLTAGTKLPDNAWLLKPGEAAGVKLMVPRAESSSLLIAVDAIEPRTGDLAAPPKEITVALSAAKPTAASKVVPTSAPATDTVKRNFNLPPPPATQHESAAAQPIPAPLESQPKSSVADSATLMRNGEKLFDVGDFTAARAFFSRARELGDREASLGLGKTYDPVVFRDRNVQGLKPDPALALKYYLEARTAGIEDAENAINGLETWLKQ